MMNDESVFHPSHDRWIGAYGDKSGPLPSRFLEPLVEGLTDECQRWNEYQNALGLHALCQPKSDERLPCSARHHGGDAVVLIQTGENGFERFRLMGTRVLAFRSEDRATKPIGNGLQVILRQSFEIVAANAEKAAAVVHDRREVVTVCEEHTFADLIGQAHERGQLLPRQCRSARAELRLIGVVLTGPRLVDAVRTHVLDGQATSLQHSDWNLIGGPDFFGPHELLGG